MKLRTGLIIALSVLVSSCGKATSVEEHETRQAERTPASGGVTSPGPDDE